MMHALVAPLLLLATLQLQSWCTKNNDTWQFKRISEEGKGCGTVGTTYMLFFMQKQCRMEPCQKHLTCYKKEGMAFFQCRYWWNLGETSERGLEGKRFIEAAIRHQASKMKQMMIMAYNYTDIIATFAVPYGHTDNQHVYIHLLHKILRP